METPLQYQDDEPELVEGYQPRDLTPYQRTRGDKPFVEFKTLRIHKPRVVATPLPGTGVSGHKQRQHERCAHTRILRNGRRISVKACLAGDPKLGRIVKDYSLEPA